MTREVAMYRMAAGSLARPVSLKGSATAFLVATRRHGGLHRVYGSVNRANGTWRSEQYNKTDLPDGAWEMVSLHALDAEATAILAKIGNRTVPAFL